MQEEHYLDYANRYNISGIGVLGIRIPDYYWLSPGFSTCSTGQVASTLNHEYEKLMDTDMVPDDDHVRWFTNTRYGNANALRPSWHDIKDGMSGHEYWHFCWRLFGRFTNSFNRYKQKIEKESDTQDYNYKSDFDFGSGPFYAATLEYANRNKWTPDELSQVWSSWIQSSVAPDASLDILSECPFINRNDQLRWLNWTITHNGSMMHYHNAGALLASYPDLITDVVPMHKVWLDYLHRNREIHVRNGQDTTPSIEWAADLKKLFDTHANETLWKKTYPILGIYESKNSRGEYKLSNGGHTPTFFQQMLFQLGYASGNQDIAVRDSLSKCLLENSISNNYTVNGMIMLEHNLRLEDRDRVFNFFKTRYPQAFTYLHSDRFVDTISKLDLAGSFRHEYAYVNMSTALRYVHLLSIRYIPGVDDFRFFTRLKHSLHAERARAADSHVYNERHKIERFKLSGMDVPHLDLNTVNELKNPDNIRYHRKWMSDLMIMLYMKRQHQISPSIREMSFWTKYVLSKLQSDVRHVNTHDDQYTRSALEHIHYSPFLWTTSSPDEKVWSSLFFSDYDHTEHMGGPHMLNLLSELFPEMSSIFQFYTSLQLNLENTFTMLDNAFTEALACSRGENITSSVPLLELDANDLF